MMPYFGAWLIQYTFTYEENNYYLKKYYAVKMKITGLEWQASETNIRAIRKIQDEK